MTDLTTPAEAEAAADNTSMGHALEKAGPGAWIVDGVDLAGIYSALDETQLNAFAHSATSGLDVTIDAGEAYVGGWLCRDRATTVTLPASATTTIYVGYDASAIIDRSVGESASSNENIIIGPAGDFASEDPRTPIYEFTTDSTTVTATTDLRKLAQPIEYDAADDITTVNGRLDVVTPGNIDDGERLVFFNGWRSFSIRRRGANASSANMSLDMEVDGNSFEVYSHAIGDTVAQFHTNGAFRARAGYAYLNAIELDGNRILWDRDITGQELHFQKDTTSAQTTMSLGEGRVGINSITNPIYPLEVQGTVAGDGLFLNEDAAGNPGRGFVAPDYAGQALPSDTEAGRIIYDSSREQ